MYEWLMKGQVLFLLFLFVLLTALVVVILVAGWLGRSKRPKVRDKVDDEQDM